MIHGINLLIGFYDPKIESKDIFAVEVKKLCETSSICETEIRSGYSITNLTNFICLISFKLEIYSSRSLVLNFLRFNPNTFVPKLK